MAIKKTKTKTTLMGTQTLLNTITGELVDVNIMNTETDEEVDCNFHKLFLKDFLNALDIVSNQKTKVSYWIVDHLTKDNLLIYSYREIAEQTGISLQTVSLTIKALKDADFLRVSGKNLIVNPDIIFKGSHARRSAVLHTFQNSSKGDIFADKQARIDNLQNTIAGLQKQIEKLQKEINQNNNQNKVTQISNNSNLEEVS